MDASSATVGELPRCEDQPVFSALLPWAIASIFALLPLAAVVLLTRRLSGSLQSPLSAAGLITVALAMAAAATTLRFLWRHAHPSPRRWQATALVLLAPMASIAAAGFAICLPGASVGVLVVFWAILLLEEGVATVSLLYDFRAGLIFGTAVAEDIAPFPSEPLPDDATTQREIRIDPPHLPPRDPPDDDFTQQLTRRRDPEGVDMLHGQLRALFLPGQQTTSVHVAFCPPFPRAPQVAAEQIDGPTARVKIVQTLPHGARLDVRFATPTTSAASVLLEFIASDQAESEQAERQASRADSDAPELAPEGVR